MCAMHSSLDWSWLFNCSAMHRLLVIFLAVKIIDLVYYSPSVARTKAVRSFFFFFELLFLHQTSLAGNEEQKKERVDTWNCARN